MDELSAWQWGLGAGVVAVAYLVRGIAGFGSGLIAVPLLALILPFTLVVPLVVVLDYLASASQGAANRADIRWREILPLLPFSALGVLLALFALSAADAELLLQGLGVFVIAFALYTLSGHTPKQGAARGWGALAGTSGGLIGTLFGTGGPFYVMYFKARGLDKAAFRATFATVFLIDGAGRLLGYAGAGLFTRDFLGVVALALPLMGVALALGGRIHTRLSQEAFQRGISVLLIVSGVALLLK
ncbi:MAG: sulfite exporter TauE/SafE family protein [Thiobacillus sp.]